MVEKLKKALLRELLYYLLTLFVLALIMHIDLLSDPSARLAMMQEKENYSHPFIYAFVIYIVIFILRKIIDFVMGLFDRKSQ